MGSACPGRIVLAATSLWSCGGNERFMEHTVSAMIPHDGSSITSSEIARKPSGFLNSTPVNPDPLATFGRWFALAIGAVMVLMAWRPLASGGTPEYFGSLLLVIAGLMLVASAANLVLLVRGAGVDLDSDLHPLVAGASRPGRPGSGRQVFLSERTRLGNLALRPEFPLWHHRHNATDRVPDAPHGRADGFGLSAKWPWS